MPNATSVTVASPPRPAPPSRGSTPCRAMRFRSYITTARAAASGPNFKPPPPAHASHLPSVLTATRDTDVPCKPAEGCKGRNACAEGYEYQKNRCNASSARRTSDSTIIIQACNHTLQCQTRSTGTTCASAVASVCKCLPDWELGTRACLKTCVRDQAQALENAGCTLSLLERSLSGNPCAYDRPEDCATCESANVCVTRDGVDTGVPCASRSDCATSAGFDGTCEKRGQCQCGPLSYKLTRVRLLLSGNCTN